MTHIRAVGQVVCAKLTHKKLVKKSGFVRRATRGIENGLVGRVECVQLAGDQPKGILPGYRLVKRRSAVPDDRLDQAALQGKAVVPFLGKNVENGMLPKPPSAGVAPRLVGQGPLPALP